MNEAGFEELYRRLEKPVYNVVYRQVWNRETARDLVQETFVRLWNMRRRVDPSTVEPLVYRIAINLARSRLRRRRIVRFVTFDRIGADPAAEPAPDVEADEARLRDAVHALPDDLRTVILLTAFTDLNYDQVGEALGIPAGTVGSRRNRALKRLRAALGDGADVERTG